MKYRHQIHRHRVTGNGWSYNPWKKLNGDIDDCDQVATDIANRWIHLFTNYLGHHNMLPLTGVEVNFSTYGVDKTELVDFINNEMKAARAALKIPESVPDADIRHYIKNVPLFSRTERKFKIHPRHAPLREFYIKYSEKLINGSLDQEEASEFLRFIHFARTQRAPAQVMEDFQNSVQDSPEVQKILTPEQRAILREELAKIRADEVKEYPDRVIDTLNPLFLTLAEAYCKQTIQSHARGHHHGAINRAYQDSVNIAHGLDTTVELTTPARQPHLTVRQVNAIKRILTEASYMFHDNPSATSPSARKLREKFGDMLFEWIHHPNDYYVHAEQISLSLIQVAEGIRYKDLRNPLRHFRNLVLDDAFRELLAYTLREYLGADMALAAGSRFTYDIAREKRDYAANHRGSDSLSIQDVHAVQVLEDRPGRITGRVEIRDFNNASSNISLSILAILATASFMVKNFYEQLNYDHENGTPDSALTDIYDRMYREHPTCRRPFTPREAIRAFRNNSITLHMMRELSALPAESPELAQQLKDDIVLLEAAVVRRHELLMRVPYGGKKNWERLKAEGKDKPVLAKAADAPELAAGDEVIEAFTSAAVTATERLKEDQKKPDDMAAAAKQPSIPQGELIETVDAEQIAEEISRHSNVAREQARRDANRTRTELQR